MATKSYSHQFSDFFENFSGNKDLKKFETNLLKPRIKSSFVRKPKLINVSASQRIGQIKKSGCRLVKQFEILNKKMHFFDKISKRGSTGSRKS